MEVHTYQFADWKERDTPEHEPYQRDEMVSGLPRLVTPALATYHRRNLKKCIQSYVRHAVD